MVLKRLDTVCLMVKDIERAGCWYEKSLDLKEVFRGNGYRVLAPEAGGVPITLEEGVPESGGSYPIFFVEDAEQVHNVLKQRGVKTSAVQTDKDNRFFDFWDPDGNRMQVCYYIE
ncbi:VOC family protein [Halobacillus sp. ACCC02827]|uniref:VOC family protein n=1 Tax=Halobacillus sp. ACCC02827 TaxID=3052090 RepID=UPI002570D4C6|nr:VOC family protein [Halobacillus sp. ACCC02827]WJE16924.1 VOC family protein [Halobacillus sp. ACCC02827]